MFYLCKLPFSWESQTLHCVLAANRSTTEGQVLRPFLQVDLMRLLLTTGIQCSSFYRPIIMFSFSVIFFNLYCYIVLCLLITLFIVLIFTVHLMKLQGLCQWMKCILLTLEDSTCEFHYYSSTLLCLCAKSNTHPSSCMHSVWFMLTVTALLI